MPSANPEFQHEAQPDHVDADRVVNAVHRIIQVQATDGSAKEKINRSRLHQVIWFELTGLGFRKQIFRIAVDQQEGIALRAFFEVLVRYVDFLRSRCRTVSSWSSNFAFSELNNRCFERTKVMRNLWCKRTLAEDKIKAVLEAHAHKVDETKIY